MTGLVIGSAFARRLLLNDIKRLLFLHNRFRHVQATFQSTNAFIVLAAFENHLTKLAF
jgi:hypothetical protein